MTLQDIKPFIDKALVKVANLTPSSFGKFTANRLPDDYLYDKWIGKKKDFTDVYLNLDPQHQELFCKYVGTEYGDSEHAALLKRFFLFCNNYDSSDFREDPFNHKENGAYLKKVATGITDPSGVRAMEVLKCYRSVNENWQKYILGCALGAKKEEAKEGAAS